MARAIQFTKMHGTGNDYIYVNTLRFPIARPEKAAIEWSAYHTGIGSDGLVLIGHSDKADFSMRIFNADGSANISMNTDCPPKTLSHWTPSRASKYWNYTLKDGP